jgi:hypothetical protein
LTREGRVYNGGENGRLWRGAKGQERNTRGKAFLGTSQHEDLKNHALRAKIEEGTEKPITSLVM